MSEADLDTRVRAQAFQFLTEQTRLHGEVVPRDLLERGFDFEGRRAPLIGPQGIFKPALLADMPISITTVPVKEGEARPYNVEFRAQRDILAAFPLDDCGEY